MSGQAEIQFRVLHFPDSEPVIGLVFMKDGQPLPPNGRVFTFELAPETSNMEADTLASLLNRRVLRLVETRPDPLPAAEDATDAAHTPEMV
jgi:hypothetical protein